MKTKDFIKMLQEADPTGEHHLRMIGGIPRGAELIEGYYDGSYNYIDDNGRWVNSSKDLKVDIFYEDTDSFVERLVAKDKTWEEIQEYFIFDLTSMKSINADKQDRFMKEVKEHFDYWTNLQKENLKESTDIALKRIAANWKFYQNKKVDNDGLYGYFMWKIYNPEINEWKSSSHYDTNGIINSGLFERIDNNELEGYYMWILKK